MYTKIGVELFARGIRYTVGFAMTYTEELARGYTYTARACEGVYGIQRLTVYPYHPLLKDTQSNHINTILPDGPDKVKCHWGQRHLATTADPSLRLIRLHTAMNQRASTLRPIQLSEASRSTHK